MSAGSREIAEGPLSRSTAAVYRTLGLGLSLAVACAPSAVLSVLLARDASNLPLYAVLLVPVAPALSAGLYLVRDGAGAADGVPAPVATFWRGYRLNLLDVLRWWVPALALATVLAVNLAHADAVASGAGVRVVSVALLGVLALLCGHALVISSRFAFRTRDVARIAVVELVGQWRATLGMLSLLVVAVGVAWVTFDLVLLLVAWVFVLLLHVVSRSVVVDVTERFVSHE